MLTEKQILAIASAYSELKDIQVKLQDDVSDTIDVDSLTNTIDEIESAFPELIDGDLEAALDEAIDENEEGLDIDTALAKAGFQIEPPAVNTEE